MILVISLLKNLPKFYVFCVEISRPSTKPPNRRRHGEGDVTNSAGSILSSWRLTWCAWMLTNGRCRQLAATDRLTDGEVTATRSTVTSCCNYWPRRAALRTSLWISSLSRSAHHSVCPAAASSVHRGVTHSALPIIIGRQTPSKQSPAVHFQFHIRQFARTPRRQS